MKRRAFKQIVSGFVVYGLLSLPSSAAIVYTDSSLNAGTSYSNNWVNITGKNLSVSSNKVVLSHRSVKIGSGVGGNATYSVRVQVYVGGSPYSVSSIYTVSSSSSTPLTIGYTAPSSGTYNVTLQVRNPQTYSPGGAYYRYETNLFQIEN